MTIKEIHAKVGSISNYLGFIVLLFCWYLLINVFSTMQPKLSGMTIEPILDWGLRLLIGPLVFAGVFGGISERQKTQGVFDGNSFFNGVKSHFWRIFGANLIYIATFFIIIISLLLGGFEQQNIGDNKFFLGFTSILSSAISLFWFSAIVEEEKIFRGLIRSIKTLLFNPIALAIVLLWGAIGFADTLLFDFQSEQIPIAINIIRSGVFAFLRILAMMYSLAIYKNVWGMLSDDVEKGDLFLDESSTTTSGGKLVKASFIFTFVSFIPLLHIVALVLGIIAMKREKRFVLRSAIACWVGGFFTILYLIFATSLFLDKPTASMNPSYQYLAEVNGDLESYVFLLENGELQEFQQQLDMEFTSNSERHWAIDNASALAKFQEYDLDGALSDFRIAAEKNPERSEFYFYYGLVLLENDQEEIAVEQFKNALVHKPNLEIAKRYVTLIETSYKPSTIISSVLFIIILLILFTLHEYGHAFAAWKLGDDTAKNSGRLTLNPIPHLDLFGSILLPAFLLIQQSDVIFGWAKPVPVNPENFKDPQKDHMRVSFAGPAINFIVSMVCTVLLGVILLFVRILWPETLSLNISDPFSSVSLMGPPFARLIVFAIVLLKQLLYTSLILGCFNLIPIPPLDGSWVFAGLLPQKVREILEKARKFSYVVFLLLVLTPAFDYIISIPISIVWGGLELLVLSMGFA